MSANQRLREAVAIINADPKRAEQLCREALAEAPGDGDAQLLLSEALRLQGNLIAARAEAEAQVRARPSWFGVHRQFGVILSELGENAPAIEALKRATDLNPGQATLWRDLGDLHWRAGHVSLARDAYERYAALPIVEPRLHEAMRALAVNDFAIAEPILAQHIAAHPNDVVAIRLLSEAQARADRPDLAEKSLRRCLDFAPGFGIARHSLGQLLNGLARFDEALAEAQELLRRDPANVGSQRLLATTYGNCGEFDKALSIYEDQLASHSAQPTIWMSYAHILKTLGRTEEAIAAYRRSIEFSPGLGLAYWSLANLKTFKFSDEEIARMERLVSRKDTEVSERVNFHFALGKAMEDAGRFADAFAHYSEGNRLHRVEVKYDGARAPRSVPKAIDFYSAEFFHSKSSVGNRAPDPIFIVGLPRSGSTLVEQILASHSAVEGTMELPNMTLIASDLCGYERAASGGSYIDALGDLDEAAFAALGGRYLRETLVHRKLHRAHFIDKSPNNWSLVGLIHLILPNAKIIDARRHPLATCFSCFKQHFAVGQHFTYDLADLGEYYSNYLRLMSHFDEVLPGRVHRVIHEDLVADPEPNIRALLAYCGLPFEPACLKPHETDRPVVTASAQQVRQPISAKRVEEWRRFELWLDPLKQALGQSLETWRA